MFISNFTLIFISVEPADYDDLVGVEKERRQNMEDANRILQNQRRRDGISPTPPPRRGALAHTPATLSQPSNGIVEALGVMTDEGSDAMKIDWMGADLAHPMPAAFRILTDNKWPNLSEPVSPAAQLAALQSSVRLTSASCGSLARSRSPRELGAPRSAHKEVEVQPLTSALEAGVDPSKAASVQAVMPKKTSFACSVDCQTFCLPFNLQNWPLWCSATKYCILCVLLFLSNCFFKTFVSFWSHLTIPGTGTNDYFDNQSCTITPEAHLKIPCIGIYLISVPCSDMDIIICCKPHGIFSQKITGLKPQLYSLC